MCGARFLARVPYGFDTQGPFHAPVANLAARCFHIITRRLTFCVPPQTPPCPRHTRASTPSVDTSIVNDAQCIHLDRVLTVEAGEHIGLVALRGALGLAAASSAGGGCAYTIARHASSSDALTCGTTLKFTRACVGLHVFITARCRKGFLSSLPFTFLCSLYLVLALAFSLPLLLSPPVTPLLSQLTPYMLQHALVS